MRWLMIALAVVAFGLVGAGCGGGDDEAGSDTDTVTITDTTDTEDTTDETTTDETTTDETDTDGSGGLASGDCQELITASSALSQAFANAGASGDLDDASEFFDEFASNAPEEIREDFQVLAEAYSGYIAALQDIDLDAGETPSPQQAAELVQALTQINQQEVSAASERIGVWANENCPSG